MSNIDEYIEHLNIMEKEFNLEFKDKELLFRSIIHDSFVYENDEAKKSNERLEFLGDAVLGIVISHLIYRNYPQWNEGEMALFKSHLVCTDSLAQKARRIDLGRFLLLGRGEEASGGRDRTSILADAMEAFLGAIYIDQGYEKAYTFIENLFSEGLTEEPPLKDYKSKLQEYSQKIFKILPTYQLIEESGPPHRKIFKMKANIGNEQEGIGEGFSKKEAEQNAAHNLLAQIENSEEKPQIN